MNKTELVDFIATKTGLTKTQSSEAVDAFVAAVQNTLSKGEEVSLIGFGVFLTGERAARTGRNPRTGEEIQIAASRLPKFKPGKGLRDAVALPKPSLELKGKTKKAAKPAKPGKAKK